MNQCIYCGRLLDYRVKLAQLLTGGMWGIPQDLVPFVCSSWCGKRWRHEHHSMRLEPWELVR